MTSGTPGFIGGRLREAREARGITAISLSEVVGITRSAISLYETGNATPQPDMLAKIADKLNIPVAYFMKPLEEPCTDTLFYRSMSSTTKLARVSAERRYEWLSRNILPFLRQYVSIPPINVYNPTIMDCLNLTDEQIENIAKETRQYWGLGNGPISNVTLLLENNGFVISQIELGAPTLDAFSAWNTKDNTPYIVIGIEKASAVRWRFNVAHELAHIILHRSLDKKRLSSTSDFKAIENQAYRFAGAFLLPAQSFVKDLYAFTLDSLLSLKPKWKVSVGVMVKRIQDLGIISSDDAKRLWINYNRRGWKTSEPLDRELAFEQPRVIRRAFELIVKDDTTMPDRVADDLTLSPIDIERLANLHPGFFNEPIPNIIPRSDLPLERRPQLNVLDEARKIADSYSQDK
jgi:Zn-dependent peptidase ImmA (M78 family)/transcriptional regulator with XRE-family HTH domain